MTVHTADPARSDHVPGDHAPGNHAPRRTAGGLVTIAATAAVLPAVILAGHRPEPWWAWFPVLAGIVLFAVGLRLHAAPRPLPDLTGRLLLFAGAGTTTAGVLLLFNAVETGWPAFPIVAGTALAALAWRKVGGGLSRVAGAFRRIAISWGAISVITGLAFATQLAGLADVAAIAPAHWYGLIVILAGASVAFEGAWLWPSKLRGHAATATVLAVAGSATILHGLIVLLGGQS